MAKRPVYLPSNEKDIFVESREIEFEWFPGFAVSQKQKSILSFHTAIKNELGVSNVLEISTKSNNKFGNLLSAFNLMVSINGIKSPVECIFQGSKVFDNGGPFRDLYNKTAIEAKKDHRIKSTGNLKYFLIEGKKWELQEDFYTWLYFNGLYQNTKIKNEIVKFDAFTDIEFNPKKSFNCQAKSAAIFTSAFKKNNDLSNLIDETNFKKTFTKKYFSNKQMSFL